MIAALIPMLMSHLKLPKWLVEALIGGIAVASLGGGSYYLGWTHRGASDDAAQAKAVAAGEAAWQQKLDQANAKGEAISATVVAQTAASDSSYQQIREEVSHVVTIVRPASAPSCPAQAAAPLRGEFSAGFIGVWNRALDPAAAGVPADSAGAAGAPAAADAASASDVDQSDLLNNHIDNAQLADGCRRQLNALIDAVQVEAITP